MAYSAWSVSFGEQPSAAKWNILGTNDASFNDGTGIADGVITVSHRTTNNIASSTSGSDTSASGTYKITALSITQTLLARPVKLRAAVQYGQRTSATTTACYTYIKESSTTLATGVGYVSGTGANTNVVKPVAETIITPTAGSHTYDVYIAMQDGTNMSISNGEFFMEYV